MARLARLCLSSARITGTTMPYVNIKITREGATPAQKAELIKGVTDLLQRVLNKNPATTFVVIDEVALEDWGIGGLPVDEFRKRNPR
jgi:4-oxalocrotonate tautomerase